MLEAQLLNGIQELMVEQRVAVSVFESGCFPVEGWEAEVSIDDQVRIGGCGGLSG